MALISLNAISQRQLVDGVVWIVGDKAILQSEVEEQRIMAQYQGIETGGNTMCMIPEQIAVQNLFLHQAVLDSIQPNESQITTRANMQLSQYIAEIGSQEKLEEYFRKSISEIREELFEAIKNQTIVQEVQAKIVGNSKITPSEVRKFFERLPEDSIPMMPATVEVEIIKIDPTITDANREEAKNQLRDLAERVNKEGADFSMLARLYSEDEGTASQGGNLGFFSKGMMEPEFSNAAFALTEVGKVSRVIETVYGYHIIQLLEKKGDRVNCRHILIRPKVSEENKSLATRQLDSISMLINDSKLRFEEAVALFSTDKETRMNGGLMANQMDGSTKFEYQNLPAEVAKVVYSMNVGDISEPFSMIDPKLGKEVYAIVKLRSKLESHKANLVDDYQTIKQYCENIKREEAIQQWIKNKIKDTYVYISPEWRECEFDFEGWIK